jgi:hypothetical protein
MRRHSSVVWVLPLLLVTAVGCTNSDGGAGVASVNGSAAPSRSGAGQRLSGKERQFRYAQCMRDHGVQMSDPQIQGDDVTFEIEDEPDQATMRKANQACNQLKNGGDGGGPPPADKMEAARQMAKCMRDHGVERFPDPDANGDSRLTESITDDPRFRQAKKTCDALAARNRPGA